MFESKFQSFTEPSDPKASRPRLASLRKELKRLKLDGFLVPRADQHQGEYVPAGEERLAWLTGFSGSAGFAVVLARRAAVFSDGRYTLQLKAQTDPTLFERVPVHEIGVGQWLAENAPESAAIGFDPRLHTVPEIERLAKILEKRQVRLVPLDANPVDTVWANRPSAPEAPILAHPQSYAGEPVAEKLHRVRAVLGEGAVDGLVVSDPHSVAWLFNIRGNDVPHTPIALCYAIVPARGQPTLFAAPRRLSDSLRQDFASHVQIADPDEMPVALRQLAQGGRVIRLDAATAGIFLKTLIERAGGKVDVGLDPIALMKAAKNEAEMAGTRAAHLRDGAVLARFLAWLEREAPGGTLDEIGVCAALETFRRDTGKLKDIAFTTIAGMGPNAAMPHYRVSKATNRVLSRGLFLVDSGAQYEDGTTDVTRTVSIGKPSPEMRDRFTRVLKGMIAISRARFPKGTTGAQLDTLARLSLWEQGLDFAHGTGHGVGSYLSVHEGPQRIAKTGTVPLEAGMIVSNEPGYYKVGRYGIRIENLVLVRPAAGLEGFLEFETLTLAPIDRRLIAKRLLSPDERDWIDAYHARVLTEVGALVESEVRRFLDEACAPL